MRTVTLELPEDLADLLDTLEPEVRNRFAVAAIERAFANEDEIDPEMLADLEAAIAQVPNDPGLTLEEAFERIRVNVRASHDNATSAGVPRTMPA